MSMKFSYGFWYIYIRITRKWKNFFLFAWKKIRFDISIWNLYKKRNVLHINIFKSIHSLIIILFFIKISVHFWCLFVKIELFLFFFFFFFWMPKIVSFLLHIETKTKQTKLPNLVKYRAVVQARAKKMKNPPLRHKEKGSDDKPTMLEKGIYLSLRIFVFTFFLLLLSFIRKIESRFSFIFLFFYFCFIHYCFVLSHLLVAFYFLSKFVYQFCKLPQVIHWLHMNYEHLTAISFYANPCTIPFIILNKQKIASSKISQNTSCMSKTSPSPPPPLSPYRYPIIALPKSHTKLKSKNV